MDAIISPHALSGSIPAIASKSMAHRILICASLCPGTTDVDCATTSKDIDATAACLGALGARITRTRQGFRVVPLPGAPDDDNLRVARRGATLDCGESGSTLRFLLPVVAALGCDARLTGHGRLAERPLSPLYEELVAGGSNLSEQGAFPLVVGGRLRPGRFELPGDVSSQFVSGLLMAAPLLGSPTEVLVAEPVQSRPYVTLTVNALATFGVHVAVTRESFDGRPCMSYAVSPATPYRSPGTVGVEGDWSNSAFWLCAGALAAPGVTVSGLDLSSAQGDRAVLGALARYGAHVTRRGDTATVAPDTLVGCEIDVGDFPDLVPPLSVVAALANGESRMRNAGRLRLKESDRLVSVSRGLASLGADVSVDGDDLVIHGVSAFSGGEVDAANDHRIAMMAAVAATRATGPVTILGAQCVLKSYPDFFEDFAALGGSVVTRGA